MRIILQNNFKPDASRPMGPEPLEAVGKINLPGLDRTGSPFLNVPTVSKTFLRFFYSLRRWEREQREKIAINSYLSK
jgi:hypothetical protein